MPRNRGRWVIAALGLTSIVTAVSCGIDPPSAVPIEEARGAALRLHLDNCRQGIGNRATAASIGDGLALTVAHSFDEVSGFEVVDSEGASTEGQVVFRDRDRDIAVISFDADRLSDVVQRGLELGIDSDAETLTVLYHREDGVFTAPTTVLRRVTASLDGVGDRAAIEIEADIQPGDSGAAVVDDEGRIAGLVFASSRVGERGWVVAVSELTGVLASLGEPLVLSCE